MVEWQTRQAQNLVSEREWGFKSLCGHWSGETARGHVTVQNCERGPLAWARKALYSLAFGRRERRHAQRSVKPPSLETHGSTPWATIVGKITPL